MKRYILNGLMLQFVFAYLIALSSIASAGRYELAKTWETGRGTLFEMADVNYPMCKEYTDNLNSFPESDLPMVCERPINPNFKQFTKPDWKKLDIEKYVDLIVQANSLKSYVQRENLYRTKEEVDKINQSLREVLLSQYINNIIYMETARLDVAGPILSPDGKPDVVMRKGRYKCAQSEIKKYGSYRRIVSYYIVNEELTKVEREIKTSLIGGPDIFLYQGKVYFDSFSSGLMPDTELSMNSNT